MGGGGGGGGAMRPQQAPVSGKVFIQRDYSGGTRCQFQSKFPAELENRVRQGGPPGAVPAAASPPLGLGARSVRGRRPTLDLAEP